MQMFVNSKLNPALISPFYGQTLPLFLGVAALNREDYFTWNTPSLSPPLPYWEPLDPLDPCQLTSSVLITKVGKSPDIGQVDGEADHRQEEVDFLSPGLSVFLPAGVGLSRGRSHQGGRGELDPILFLHQDELHL